MSQHHLDKRFLLPELITTHLPEFRPLKLKFPRISLRDGLGLLHYF